MQKRNFTISGYTTTYNCAEMLYPFRECIESLLGFCDEVIVVDAGSTDSTIEELQKIAARDARFKFFVEPVNFNHPRWAIYQDGYLKAKARARCSGDYCWQTDTDEIVHPSDFEKMKYLPLLMNGQPMLMLPMVEFWGDFDRIRADFFSWKTRFSINDKRITHGIPDCFRMFDETGHEYCRPYDSDSCNYIVKDTLENLNPLIPIPSGFGDLRQVTGLTGEAQQIFFHRCLDELPSVQHVSWLNLERKIDHYRRFWGRFHASMYNLHVKDIAANNVMFEKPWKEVTDDEIRARAVDLKNIGPRSFHYKIDWNKIGATMPFERPVAESLLKWRAGLPPFGTQTSAVAASIPTTAPAPVEEKLKPQLNTTLEFLREQAQSKPLPITVRENPAVSAIVTSYNKASFLRDSIGSLIKQDYSNLEILIVNDGSPDETSSVVRSIINENPAHKIRLLEKQNGGISDARNYGVAQASAGIILTLDGDDMAKPTFVAKAIRAIQEEDANIVCSNVELFGDKTGTWEPPLYDKFFQRYTTSIPSLPVYEKRLWEEVGGYSKAFPFVEDWDFWVRCSRLDPTVVKLEEPLFLYHVSKTGLADIFTNRHSEVQAMIALSNQDLFSVTELLNALETTKRFPRAFFDKFVKQDQLHPKEWLLKFWLGLEKEQIGDRRGAFDSYLVAFELNQQQNWLIAYKLAEMLLSVGDQVQAYNLLHLCRTLRPDTQSIVNPTISELLSGSRAAAQS